EQHPLDPSALHHLFDQGDGGAGLARAGGHHQQGTALVGVEVLADLRDRPLLVGASRDRGLRIGPGQRLPQGAATDQLVQLVAGVEAGRLAWWVAGGVVPELDAAAVAEEDDRALPDPPLEVVGVEPRLRAADGRLDAGALGLAEAQRAPAP